MTQDDGFFYWQRGDSTPFNNYFTTNEFTCKCGQCREQKIAKELITRLLKARMDLNSAVMVHSGYRCSSYQNQLKNAGYETAVGISQHELGKAADLASVNMGSLLAILREGFKALGVAHTFIHCDLRDDKERYWSYVKA